MKLSVRISQRDDNGGGYRSIILKREIRFRPNAPVSWRSVAEKSDTGTIIDDGDQIQSLRDGFMPRHLARFFFFDAEKSQSVNLGESEIVEGVSRILGLFSYEGLENDLRSLEQNKFRPSSSDVHEINNKIADVSGQISKSQNLLISRKQELEAIEVDLRDTEDELHSVEDELTTRRG